jgi:hypothetical protein
MLRNSFWASLALAVLVPAGAGARDSRDIDVGPALRKLRRQIDAAAKSLLEVRRQCIRGESQVRIKLKLLHSRLGEIASEVEQTSRACPSQLIGKGLKLDLKPKRSDKTPRGTTVLQGEGIKLELSADDIAEATAKAKGKPGKKKVHKKKKPKKKLDILLER